MPLPTDETPNPDYFRMKQAAEELNIGEYVIVNVSSPKVARKYIYDIKLRFNPKKEFRTKKVSETSIRINRTM